MQKSVKIGVIRVVLDTVVFVRALINPKSICGRLAFDLCNHYVLITSPAVLREVLEVINRVEMRLKSPNFVKVPFDQVLSYLARAEVVNPELRIKICRDPNDDKFIEAAVAGKARYLVTEDQDLLVLHQYKEVQMVNCSYFVGLIEVNR